jgi:hypothetical protein
MSAFSYVYFIREVGVERGPVKIGCSQSPEARLAAFSPLSPRPLEIAAKIGGDFLTERGFHTLFQLLNTHSEWFSSAPELEACIASINAGTFDLNTVPSGPSAIRSLRSVRAWKERQAREAA